MSATYAVVPKPENLGRCYELAAKKVGYSKDATLVHGTIQGFGKPPLDHAWAVLADGSVWEPATGRAWPADFFAAFFNPVVKVTYTATESRLKMVQEKHFGPWDESC